MIIITSYLAKFKRKIHLESLFLAFTALKFSLLTLPPRIYLKEGMGTGGRSQPMKPRAVRVRKMRSLRRSYSFWREPMPLLRVSNSRMAEMISIVWRTL